MKRLLLHACHDLAQRDDKTLSETEYKAVRKRYRTLLTQGRARASTDSRKASSVPKSVSSEIRIHPRAPRARTLRANAARVPRRFHRRHPLPRGPRKRAAARSLPRLLRRNCLDRFQSHRLRLRRSGGPAADRVRPSRIRSGYPELRELLGGPDRGGRGRGGRCAANPHGREMGIARKIALDGRRPRPSSLEPGAG